MYDSPGTSVAMLIMFLCGILLLIYIQVLLIRWVFKIDTQLKNQRATVWLLLKLLEKQGATKEEVAQLMTSLNIK